MLKELDILIDLTFIIVGWNRLFMGDELRNTLISPSRWNMPPPPPTGPRRVRIRLFKIID